MNIYEAVNKYVQSGYSEDDAIPKVAQDIILLKIGNSKYSKNITVKGGVVMHNISKDMRRATRAGQKNEKFLKKRRSIGTEKLYAFILSKNLFKNHIKYGIV